MIKTLLRERVNISQGLFFSLVGNWLAMLIIQLDTLPATMVAIVISIFSLIALFIGEK